MARIGPHHHPGGEVAVLVWVESCGVFDVADVNPVLHNPLLGL